MADRSFLPPQGHLEVNVAGLFGSVTFGASGAVASFTGKGIASVTHGATDSGTYTITLTDSYSALLWAGYTFQGATSPSVSTGGFDVRTLSNTVSSTTPTIVIQCLAATPGPFQDPVAGSSLTFRFDLRNSSVS